MKNHHLFLGILLTLVGGISLSSFLWKDEIPKKDKLVENKKYIKDPKLDASIKSEKPITLSNVPIKTNRENVNYSNTMNDAVDTLKTQGVEEREYKRILAIENRKSKMDERKRYKNARLEWRKALNKARKEAKLTGDYSKFEAIKEQEPGKE